MKNIFSKLLISALTLFISTLMFSQAPPPPPEDPNSGDIGGISQPIDMYIITLAIVAVIFIINYSRKLSLNKY